jgi:hypothetical protein
VSGVGGIDERRKLERCEKDEGDRDVTPPEGADHSTLQEQCEGTRRADNGPEDEGFGSEIPARKFCDHLREQKSDALAMGSVLPAKEVE